MIPNRITQQGYPDEAVALWCATNATSYGDEPLDRGGGGSGLASTVSQARLANFALQSFA